MKKDKKKKQPLFPEKIEKVTMPSGRTFTITHVFLGCQETSGIISHE